MTEATQEFYDRLDEALAYHEEQADISSKADIKDVVALFPDCENALRKHLQIRNHLGELCEPIRQVTTATCTLPQIDGYEKLVEIGRGGMGVVYRAEQRSTQRTVAIKVIRPERLAALTDQDREEIIARFRIEAIATMDHNNIVRVYHTGNVSDDPFFVMEFVQGSTLRELVQSGNCSVKEVVAYLEQAARGIHHAHQHGVLHRDIKPANIIVDAQTNTAKVADFGLAKLDHMTVTESDSEGTQPAVVMGTLPYMSPEQAVDSEDITVASDVYGLGATLYEALSGEPPFRGQVAEVRGAIATKHPQLLREINSDIPKRLEKICAKCLSKDPSDRFDSAKSFADELAKLRTATSGNAAVLFANMGWPLLIFGLLGLVLHGGVHWLVQQNSSEPFIWLCVFGTYLPLFAMFWFTKMPKRYQTKAAERELWSIWCGHLLAVAIAFAAIRTVAMDINETLAVGYPVFAATTGMALFAMAANFWRYHYALATMWTGVAMTMIFTSNWAAIEFGIATAITGIVVGVYELYLLREQLMDKPVRVTATNEGDRLQDVSILGYPVTQTHHLDRRGDK